MGKIFLESPFGILVFFHPGTCFAGFVESKDKTSKVTNHINDFYVKSFLKHMCVAI